MEVLVDGSRTHPDLWFEAQTMSSASVPPISQEEHRTAQSLSLSDDQYARSKYAIEETRVQLQSRARRLGELVNSLLPSAKDIGEVNKVWFNTYRGLYRVNLGNGSSDFQISIPEDVADGVLNSGSSTAKMRLEKLLLEQLPIATEAKAS